MILMLLSIVLWRAQAADSGRAQDLQQAGQERPEIFLKHLVLASIPAGAEIPSFDTRLIGTPVKPWPAAITSASRQELAVAFNNGHSDYEAKLMGGVIVIRPASIEGSYLDEKTQLRRLQARGLVAATQQLFAPKNIGRFGVFNLATDAPISFDMSVADLSVIEVLNQLVTEARGNAWLVSGPSTAVLYLQSNGFLYSSAGSRTP